MAIVNLKKIKEYALRPNGKLALLYQNAGNRFRILDVGCGNDSSFITKSHFPNCNYVGIDIGDYNSTKPNCADAYVLCDPDNFASEIGKLGSQFDFVISAHNLEHCNDRKDTLVKMSSVLAAGGMLFLSFPTSESVHFQSRAGTLNYFDDNTHQGQPPDLEWVLDLLKAEGLEIVYVSRRNRPLVLFLFGLLNEIRSRLSRTTLRGTWQLYGFETIIWAKKGSPIN